MAFRDGLIYLLGGAIVDDAPGPDANDAVGVLNSELHMVDIEQNGDAHFLIDADKIPA